MCFCVCDKQARSDYIGSFVNPEALYLTPLFLLVLIMVDGFLLNNGFIFVDITKKATAICRSIL